MALPARQQALYWGIAAAVFLGILWLLGDVLLPFVLGGAIAYLLDPIADRLERLGLSRGAAVAIISVTFALVGGVALFLIIPMMVRQFAELIALAPEVTANVRGFVELRFPAIGDRLEDITGTIPGLGETIREKGAALLNRMASSAMTLVGLVTLFFIVPIVAIYMLLDWDKLIAAIDELLPRDHAPVIRRLAREMDATLAGFLRGQGTVCLIQGTFYAVALMAVGLNFGLIVGAVGGLLSFIPFVGSIAGGILSIGLALFQFWGQWGMIALVAGIFFFGQIVEGNILTPKLVGSSVGLHPVWLLFSLSVFGALFGFVGLLVAVPVSAMIGVVVRFAVEQYRAGMLYQGISGREDETARLDAPDSAAQ